MSETQSKSFKAQVVTVSDSRSTGEREDTVGPELVSILSEAGYITGKPVIVPDIREDISVCLMDLVDKKHTDLVITTGGTGLSPRDVTPEATLDVIDFEIPGFAECMRVEGAQNTKFAWLSRGVSGARKQSIIVNLPGSQRGAIQSLNSLLPLFRHAIEIVRGDAHECGKKLNESDDIPAIFINDDIMNRHFDKAMKLLLSAKTTSAASIQRDLKIAFPRACKILKMMENKGVISEGEVKKERRLIEDSDFLLNYTDTSRWEEKDQ